MKNNPRITRKERGLLKGALRRVFSRSDHRKSALDVGRVDWFDESRKRVKKWTLCDICKKPTPTYLIDIDHMDPVQPIGRDITEIGLDELADRLWCDLSRLQRLCETCHGLKTKEENVERRRIKKEGKNK